MFGCPNTRVLYSVIETRMLVHCLTIIYIYTTLVIGIVYNEGNSHLDLLFQKALHYERHSKNFREHLSNTVMQF